MALPETLIYLGQRYVRAARSRGGKAGAPAFIGDFADQLARRYSEGRQIDPPVDAWYVADSGANGRPEKVKVTMVRGPLDRTTTRHDYAELSDGRHPTSLYIFPVSGYSKPQFALISDQYGDVHNWVSLPRGWDAERASRYGITLKR